MQLDIQKKVQILAVWKPLGISTHTISKQVSHILQVPVAHTGTLDPMAEGVIVLLTGDERFNKYELAGWQKVYEFEVTFGISTDTYDLMGFIQQLDMKFELNKEALSSTLTHFTKTYSQKYPPFSAKKVKGKPLHYYAQHNTLDQIDIPSLTATIYELEQKSVGHISAEQLYSTATAKITRVEGFFRQEAILQKWKDFSANTPHDHMFATTTLKAVVSRGVYVRTLAVDIAAELGTVALVSNLLRTHNGDFSREKCLEYEQILAHLRQAE